MKLSDVSRLPSFALFGPGFADGRWTLLSDLAAEEGVARVVFAPYESEGKDARVLGAARVEQGDLERDVPPASISPELDETGHAEAVETIREAIASGDVYQVNFTLRARFGPVDGASLLAALCRREVPRFAAWMRLPDGTEIVSASPELFFEHHDRHVHVQPMKGTAPADGLLEKSDKDACELAMITDLLRNDLVPVCQPRSVTVAAERRFLPLAYAVQSVSDVEGVLLPGLDALDVLDALHPGGSITGAPKQAAMEMIARLETSPRGAYCGALGLWTGDRAVFSLLIRTAQREEAGWVYGVGGGIVWGSNPQAELEEARLKLGALR